MREASIEDASMVVRFVTTDDGWVYLEVRGKHDTATVFTSGKWDRVRFVRLLHAAGVL